MPFFIYTSTDVLDALAKNGLPHDPRAVVEDVLKVRGFDCLMEPNQTNAVMAFT